MNGRVYLVGAGPGDPGLLTLKGREALQFCDCVVYDSLVNPALLDWAPPFAERIFVGKRAGVHCMPQQEIHGLLIERARAGLTVVRLKGGDPFLFGRGGEEAEALQAADVPWEVIPGVSSALAVPAAAGIPVTHRGLSSSLAVVTAHKQSGPPQWERLATAADTLVILMCSRNLTEITAGLIRAGRAGNTPAAFIQSGTCPNQQVETGTLQNIAERVRVRSLGPPALLVVGEVVSLSEKLASLCNEVLSCVP